MRHVAVAAICDTDNTALKAAARLFGKATRYTDFKTLFENESLDFVDICVPSDLHSAVAKEALRRGFHVILEKPLATSYADAAELVTLARTRHVELVPIQNFKHYESVRKAKELLQSGGYGQAKAFTATASYRLGDRGRDSWIRRAGGPLWEYGVHYVYLAQYLMGQVLDVSVSAPKRDAQDNATVSLRHEGGASSTIQLIQSRVNSWSLDILTSDIRIRILLGLDVLTIGRGSSVIGEMKMNGTFIAGGMMNALRYLVRGVTVTPHYRLLSLAVESLLRGGPAPESADEALETIRLLETIALKLGNAR
jgi:predicted dehydrogenase